jgi:hypothetical protein
MAVSKRGKRNHNDFTLPLCASSQQSLTGPGPNRRAWISSPANTDYRLRMNIMACAASFTCTIGRHWLPSRMSGSFPFFHAP